MSIEKIFVSYSRADGADFALRLSLDLKKRGFDVWIDQEDIRAGAEWDLEIEKALKASDCLLFIETEKSVSSNNVLDEVYYALEQHKKVIPLIFIDSKTPFRLQRLQHIDFSKDYNSGLAQLINELKASTSAGASLPEETTSLKAVNKPFYSRHRGLVLAATFLLIIIVAAIIYTGTNKNRIHPDNLASDNQEMAGTLNLNDDLLGDWELVDVEPKAQLARGYLKIADIDGKKVTIKSNLQFYFSKTNDSSFLTVFNAFAGCSSCILKKDTKLIVEDISIGSRFIKIAQGKLAGDGKAGDTLMDAGSTKSIHGYATLHIVDNKTILIEVKQTAATELAHELVLQPFVYSFRFSKSE